MSHQPIHDCMAQGLREKVFPGAVLLVGRGDTPVFFEAYGHANLFTGQAMTRDTVFDLASLTKPLATTLAVAKLVDGGRLDWDRPIEAWMPRTAGGDKAAVTVRQLLAHRSGLPAHRPYFMRLRSLPPFQRRAALLDMLLDTPLAYRPGEARCYSDLGFMLLCRLVEQVAGCRMDRFLTDAVYAPMDVNDLFFADLHTAVRHRYVFAATELCPLRNRLLVGEVHDDNAWFAGGVDGHAGLFGTAAGVFGLLRRLAAAYFDHPPQAVFDRSMMTRLFGDAGKNHFSLGFDRPSAENSSAGRHFSKATVGHLGFTGVSFWMDLSTDVTVILLTNRVHPLRWNDRLREFRPALHDLVMEHFEIVSD